MRNAAGQFVGLVTIGVAISFTAVGLTACYLPCRSSSVAVQKLLKAGKLAHSRQQRFFYAWDSGETVERPIGFYVLFFGILPTLIASFAYWIFCRRSGAAAATR